MSVRFRKQPDENLDYDFDWSAWMASGDTLQASTGTSVVSATTGITVGTKTHNTSTSIVKQFLSGGTADADYEIECTVTTTQGRIGQREIILEVRETP